MATRFKAAVLVELNSPLEVMELALSDSLSQGQVLVEVKSAGVCGSQLLEIAGRKGNSKYLPHLLGHEGFGEVLEVGPGVKKVECGDKVILHWRLSSGYEASAPVYSGPGGMRIGAGKLATFASLSVVSENRITKVSRTTDPLLASLMGCGLSTGMSSVRKQAKVSMDDSIIILGSGGVGLSACLAASAIGAKKIVVVDKDVSKEYAALNCGATAFATIDEKEDKNLVSDEFISSFDSVLETTGSPAMSRIALSLAKDGGTVIQLGQSDPSTTLEIGTQGPAFGVIEGKKILFSQGGGFKPDEDLEVFIQQITQTKSRHWRNLLGPNQPLENINFLIEGLRSGVPGRPIVTF